MDDFNLSTLHESKSEWAGRLMTILTPLVIEQLRAMFNESIKMCVQMEEPEKYLVNFQNALSQIPKWGNATVETQCKRMIERSGCNYLDDMITSVHIVQLKILTAMRVGSKQKKININVPKLDVFIHNVYINTARKLYNNVYLYDTSVAPLQVQKNYRELEIIIQECILNTIRQSIPVETILRAYMDETVEEEVTEEIQEQIVPASETVETAVADEVPASTNPELTELREMQKMLAEEPTPEPVTIIPETAVMTIDPVVDIAPLSRPVSMEDLTLTSTAEEPFKLNLGSVTDADDSVQLDFEDM